MNEKIKFLASILLAAVLGIFIYIVVHEAGHSLVVLIYGGRITEFSIFHAHMSYEGAVLTGPENPCFIVRERSYP